jgi:hypothetical protein
METRPSPYGKTNAASMGAPLSLYGKTDRASLQKTIKPLCKNQQSVYVETYGASMENPTKSASMENPTKSLCRSLQSLYGFGKMV